MQQQMSAIAVDHIQPKDGFNPRRYFDDSEFAALRQSVEEHGVLQPIVVRGADNDEAGFVLVAGERRWRAAREAGLGEIPAVVIDGDDDKALAVATAENTMRSDMSPAEEAEAARRMLTACDGDKDETCRVLGWSRSKLDGRLALLDADERVLDALAHRQIRLGHAELLASLPGETQRGTLDKIMEEGIPVDQVRGKLDAFALYLSTAIFDLSDCQGCPHNTGKQASLFSESIGEGRCTNRECFTAKTQEALEAKRDEARSQYPVIWLDKERDSDSYTFLQRTGPNGVGPEQYEQGCKACGDYGAVMVTHADRLGALDEDVCFNLPCHKEKVAAYQASLSDEGGDASGGDTTETGQVSGQSASKAGKGKSKGQGKAQTGSSGAAPAANTTPKQVREVSNARVRTMAAGVAQRDDHLGRCATAHALLTTLERTGVSLTDDANRGVIAEALGDSALAAGAEFLSGTAQASKRIEALYPYTAEQLDALNRALATLFFTGEGASDNAVGFGGDRTDNAKAAVAATGADPAEGFRMDAAFLGTHTKAGMEAVCQEAGFDAWYDAQHGEGAFKRLVKGKAKDLPDQIMAAGFDWTGFVPTSVRSVLGHTTGTNDG